MREGFRRMDARLEDLIHQIDRRFEQLDKRFEQIDKRFSALQWTIMFAMALLSFLITLFSYLKPPVSPEALEKAIYSALEKAQKK